MILKISALVLFWLAFYLNCFSFSDVLVVAQDGTGDFHSIQEALEAIPSHSKERIIIYIKNGTYSEKIFIEKNNVALIGEDRDQTKIVYAELRKNWREKNTDDYGSSVVNIKNNVTDILFSTLTVYNNYGSVYGDHDHAFSIRAGEGVTRIIIDNCNIISDGGDTVSLWNKDDGMYYHSNSYFEGWVDYVCPRGYCFIENSKFFGNNLTASIWHDGSQNEDHKFVLRNCRFDGVNGFPLGRFHRDAQFFLIDCTFSNNMSDQKIFFAQSNPPRILQWGENRQYFFNCHGDSTDFIWYGDNLQMASRNLIADSVSAIWTFNNLWDPKTELEIFYQSFPENNKR
jgi:pectinesterase